MSPVRDLLAKARLALGTAQECYSDVEPDRACEELERAQRFISDAAAEIQRSAAAGQKVRADNGR